MSARDGTFCRDCRAADPYDCNERKHAEDPSIPLGTFCDCGCHDEDDEHDYA